MSMESMLWANTGVGDGLPGGYTAAQTQQLFGSLLNAYPANDGVLAGYEDEMICDVTDTEEITVNTGLAVIDGIAFRISSPEVVPVPVPVGATGGTSFILTAQINRTTQTGSILVVYNATDDSVNTPNISIYQTVTTWVIPLCYGVIEVDGSITMASNKNEATATRYAGVTDVRRLVGGGASGMSLVRSYTGNTTASLQRAIYLNDIPKLSGDLEIRLSCIVGVFSMSRLDMVFNNTISSYYSHARISVVQPSNPATTTTATVSETDLSGQTSVRFTWGGEPNWLFQAQNPVYLRIRFFEYADPLVSTDILRGEYTMIGTRLYQYGKFSFEINNANCGMLHNIAFSAGYNGGALLVKSASIYNIPKRTDLFSFTI